MLKLLNLHNVVIRQYQKKYFSLKFVFTVFQMSQVKRNIQNWIEFCICFYLCNIIMLDIKIKEKEKKNITTTDKIKILWKIKYFQNIIILREAFPNAMVSIWYFHFCICLMRFFYMVKLWHIHGNIICVINESFMCSDFVLTILLIKTIKLPNQKIMQ